MSERRKSTPGSTRPASKRLRDAGSGPPKLEDVARLAGLSTATVSRVLNQPESVRPESRRLVLSAVEALGYVPDGAAQALARRRSNTVGAVIPTIDNAIFARGIQALQAQLHEAGFTLLLASTDYDEKRELDEVQSLIRHGVDGLMMVGDAHPEPVYALIERKNIPFVNTWIYRPDSPHPCIGFDNREAAARIARYLIELGHRKIAMIAGVTSNNDRAADRVTGAKQALEIAGLGFAEGHLVESIYDISDGRGAMAAVMDTAEPPTAVICGNDVLALGALFECQARGVSVPEDVSVTGFDDLDIARHLKPAITTMQVPSDEMGRRAADFLLARLEDRPVHDHTLLEVNLVVRGTTAPPTS